MTAMTVLPLLKSQLALEPPSLPKRVLWPRATMGLCLWRLDMKFSFEAQVAIS